MRRKLLSVLIGNVFAAVPLLHAAEGLQVTSGSVSLGLRHVEDKATDPSKLQEYRDLDENLLNHAGVRLQGGDGSYLSGFVENLGHDDFYAVARGGQYGRYEYYLYGNGLRHRFGSGIGAITPYSGVGTTTLTATFPKTNIATWTPFSNAYTRKDFGGAFEWQAATPWYFRTDANQVRRDGMKVISASQGTSPGQPFMTLPVPVDFRTTNFGAEAGYQTRRQHYSVRYDQSEFSNGNETVRWTNPTFGGLDTAFREPDNDYWKISGNGVIKQLPMRSTLGMRASYSKLTNNVGVFTGLLNTGGATAPTNPNTGTFHGDVRTKTVSFALTSSPLARLDTRLYWNWTRKDNQSTQMVFATGGVAGLQCGTLAGIGRNCVPELFNYRKNNLGAEAGYRLNPANRILVGYDRYDTFRQRYDSMNTVENKYFAELRNSTLDTVSARLRYHHLTRRSSVDGFDPTNPIDQFVRRFDVANVDQNAVKLVLDISPPVRHLDIGLEAIYKKNDYKNVILGRTDDYRHEYFATVSYGDPQSFRVTLFGDIEFAEYDSYHRVGTGSPNPAAPPTATTYNWSSKVKDRSWQLGVGTEWRPRERLALHASLVHLQTHGSVDFSRQIAPPVVPINNYDDTRRTALNLRGTYTLDKQWSMTGGYAWEKYRFSDIRYDGYRHVVGTGTGASYLTGEGAFPEYTAHIFYVYASYSFR